MSVCVSVCLSVHEIIQEYRLAKIGPKGQTKASILKGSMQAQNCSVANESSHAMLYRVNIKLLHLFEKVNYGILSKTESS